MDGKFKKSRKEYLGDFIGITKAMGRTIRYSVKLTPTHTIGFLLTIAVSALTPFLSSLVNSKMIDELVHIVSQGSIFSDYLKMLLGAWIVISILSSLIDRCGDYFKLHAYFAFSREFDRDVTRKFAYLDLENYENADKATLIQKVRENYGSKPISFLTGSFDLIDTLISSASAFVILISFAPIFIVLMIISTIPQFINNVFFGKRAYFIWSAKGDIKKDYQRSKQYLTDYTSLQEVGIFRIKEYLIDRVYKLYLEFQNAQKKVETRRILVRGGLDFLRVFGFSAAMVILAIRVISKAITIGAFTFYISTLRSLQSSLSQFFGTVSGIYEDGLFMVDLYKFEDLENKIISGEMTLPVKPEAPKIEINNLSFKYQKTDVYALGPINLTINPGEHVAIVGENGAGKTTLIKLLMRFYDPTDGEILIDGINVKDLNLDNWYKHVGAIFQEFNGYHFDAKLNIGVGDIERAENIEEIEEASKKAGAHEFISKYEKKYDQILSRWFEGGTTLSLGQWQRVALARAFFKNAPILILDEPTSAIDAKAEFEIFERLFEFTKGKTVIIISHRFSTVRNASRIIVLDHGQIVEDGSHDELIKIEGGKYKTAFEIQRKGYE